MTESIGARLTQLISPIVKIYLSEAETETYPYATYEQTLTEARTKDGVYKIMSDCTIDVYDKSFDTVNSLAAQICASIDANMDGPKYIAKFVSLQKNCLEGIWDIQLNFSIKQTQ